MNVSKFRLHTTELEKLTQYLRSALSFDYKNHSEDMNILASERYYLRNNSTQLNMVVVKRNNSMIWIDIIATAGGAGIFNINLWSEKGYIKKVRKVLDQYAENQELVLEELQ